MTRHQYKGRRPKRKQRAPATGGASAARPSHVNGDAPDLDCSSFIRSVDDFVSASERKLKVFDDEGKRQDERGSTFICEIDAMQNLVSGAVCPTADGASCLSENRQENEKDWHRFCNFFAEMTHLLQLSFRPRTRQVAYLHAMEVRRRPPAAALGTASP